MALNFPNSPAVNDEYSYGGFLYRWDGVKWTTVVGTVDDLYVKKSGDTMSGDLITRAEGKSGTQIITSDTFGAIRWLNTSGYMTGSLGGDTTTGNVVLAVRDGTEVGNITWQPLTVDNANQLTVLSSPVSSVVQVDRGDALTRKDYVDSLAPIKRTITSIGVAQGEWIANDTEVLVIEYPTHYDIQGIFRRTSNGSAPTANVFTFNVGDVFLPYTPVLASVHVVAGPPTTGGLYLETSSGPNCALSSGTFPTLPPDLGWIMVNTKLEKR